MSDQLIVLRRKFHEQRKILMLIRSDRIEREVSENLHFTYDRSLARVRALNNKTSRI